MAAEEFIRGDALSRLNSRETANGNAENLLVTSNYNLQTVYKN
jgi:hypothetical protein